MIEPIIASVDRKLRENPGEVLAWQVIPLSFYHPPLPDVVRSSWAFVLRANIATGAERHPNSHQRMMSYRGRGDLQTQEGEHWCSHHLTSDIAAPREDRWISIPPNVWHQGVAGPNQWAVVSFHTAEEHALIEERPATGPAGQARQRRYAEFDPSVLELWTRYLATSGKPPSTPLPPVWHFCDNALDADICAELVLTGRKRATAPSLWFFKSHGLEPPRAGNLDIVTNWNGIAQCIIRTTAVQIMPFRDVTAEHARLEGERDSSLESWRTVHWAYYQRELKDMEHEVNEAMPIVCQYFEVAFR